MLPTNIATSSETCVLAELHARRWHADDLFFAIAWRDRGAVERILAASPAAISERTPGGLTPASLAEWVGDSAMSRLLRQASRVSSHALSHAV